MITRDQLEKQMAEFRDRMATKPLRPTLTLPPIQAETDETGVSDHLRELVERQRGEEE